MKPHPELFPWFFGAWVALALASYLFFRGNANVERKKRFMPAVTIGTGIVFLGFVFAMSGQLREVLFGAPFVALISYINIRNTKFCDSCGETVHNIMWFSKIEFCARCGAKIT